MFNATHHAEVHRVASLIGGVLPRGKRDRCGQLRVRLKFTKAELRAIRTRASEDGEWTGRTALERSQIAAYSALDTAITRIVDRRLQAAGATFSLYDLFFARAIRWESLAAEMTVIAYVHDRADVTLSISQGKSVAIIWFHVAIIDRV